MKIFLLLITALFFLASCGEDPIDSDLLYGPVLGADAEQPNPEIRRVPYEFHVWHGFDGAEFARWGDDETSQHWEEMFNIRIRQSAPEYNAMEALMTMIVTDDLPDAIFMRRDSYALDLANRELLVPISRLEAMVHNTWFADYVGRETQAMLAFEGVNYAIPANARTGAIGTEGASTGGNLAWMVTTNAWQAVGSPIIRTFEDLFDYAMAVRDAGLTNASGRTVFPLLINEGTSSYGAAFVNAIFRAKGGVVDQKGFTITPEGTYGSVLRIPQWFDAVMEANRWYRYGLFSSSNLTRSETEFYTALQTGRGGLVLHDFSADNKNHFRDRLRDYEPGNSIELIIVHDGGRAYLFPPALGLPPSRIYHEHHVTFGENALFITTAAERPERIFEFFTWLLTPMGTAEMLEAPQWNFLNPITHMDRYRFAHQQSWATDAQARFATPRLRLTNEFVGIATAIPEMDPLYANLQQINARFNEALPAAIFASTQEEAQWHLAELLDFAENLNLADIEYMFNERWVYNKEMQRGSIFRLLGEE